MGLRWTFSIRPQNFNGLHVLLIHNDTVCSTKVGLKPGCIVLEAVERARDQHKNERLHPTALGSRANSYKPTDVIRGIFCLQQAPSPMIDTLHGNAWVG